MNWLTASELAGLPGMPASEFRTRAKLQELGVPSRLRAARGGGREYDCSALPAETRQSLMVASVHQAPTLPAAPESTGPVDLVAVTPATLPVARRTPPSHADSACADARAVLMRKLADLAATCGGITAAANLLSHQLAQGDVAVELLVIAGTANRRARKAQGDGVRISVRTLFDWHKRWTADGWWGLLPEPTAAAPVAALPQDVAAVLKGYASAAGSARNLSHVAQRVTLALGRPLDDWRKLYDQARRALPKLDKTRLIKARHKGAERAAKLPFKRRDTSVLKPLDVCLVDGHTFKAKVRHPEHGAPFAPEVTLVMDAASRKVTGWSVSLSESTIAVGDAIRHSVGTHGIHAIVYSDNGSGEKAKRFDCPVDGLFARLGCSHPTGIPGHPQGHGLIERAWQTHMIKCARQFGSYQGRDVDARTLRDVRLELASEQRALARARSSGDVVQLSTKAPSWAQFIDAVAKAVDDYNTTHRHRSLPKHTEGPLAGKHMTPAEAWDAMLDPADQTLLDGPSLYALFMPSVLRKAVRGEVQFINQVYASPDLMAVDGEQVSVRYDIHDPHKVQVWTLGGEFVCDAVWNANRIDYFPKPFIEFAKERRVRSTVKLRESQIDTALRELNPTLPAPVADGWSTFPSAAPRATELVERIDPAPAPAAEAGIPGRPSFFDCASDRYEWLMRHHADWQDSDRTWLADYVASPDYGDLREYYASRGLAWPDDTDVFNAAG